LAPKLNTDDKGKLREGVVASSRIDEFAIEGEDSVMPKQDRH
jgi:hypothetical protein